MILELFIVVATADILKDGVLRKENNLSTYRPCHSRYFHVYISRKNPSRP